MRGQGASELSGVLTDDYSASISQSRFCIVFCLLLKLCRTSCFMLINTCRLMMRR
jgi:hypothetical protein